MTNAMKMDRKTVDEAIEAGQRIVLTRAADNAERRLACKRMLLKAIQAFPHQGLAIRYERAKGVGGEGFTVLILETKRGMPRLRRTTQEAVRAWVAGYETAKDGD
jgi:methylaspartate ammonia-lyase